MPLPIQFLRRCVSQRASRCPHLCVLNDTCPARVHMSMLADDYLLHIQCLQHCNSQKGVDMFASIYVLNGTSFTRTQMTVYGTSNAPDIVFSLNGVKMLVFASCNLMFKAFGSLTLPFRLYRHPHQNQRTNKVSVHATLWNFLD
ncbi:hypothetical protein V6N11_051509 [Hibiscus sabdariffa]|uniref:Uncharacterized protein n=1 Tax=Hibiscus sabdariffa TaxID=183260 RepID=A0ABR2U7C5_9ROSI